MKCFKVVVKCTNASGDTCNLLPEDCSTSEYVDAQHGVIYVVANHINEVANEFQYVAISIREIGAGYFVDVRKSIVLEPKA